MEVPVGMAMLGRVVDPLGRPLDGGPPIEAESHRLAEIVAPGIAARQPVNEPLYTGIKAIDSMIPIGRGQRELIIGDRKTGKTTVAVDTIINQGDQDVVCVYVAIGQKESTVADIIQTLRDHGAMKHSIVVATSSASPAPIQYLAPYAGCAMGEYFMYSLGKHVLVVYDDLLKHAAAARQMSLLLRRPPGREAYSGDIFYVHSRLLERAAKLAERFVIIPRGTTGDAPPTGVDGKVYLRGEGRQEAEEALAKMPEPAKFEIRKHTDSGGSLTALPIVETLEGEVSAYIPTNLISITDGQIYLDPSLFFAGIRPAINAGISVSRVGGAAQIQAMKQVSASLRLDLAAYREMKVFAQMSTELGPATQRQLDRGARIVELLKQPLHQPFAVTDQVISIYAATRSHLDKVQVEDVARFESELLAFMKSKHADLYESIRTAKAISDADRGKLEQAVQEFRNAFAGTRKATA
jgi:F-type H+-transporting ATPase subunit alpha